jgi:hypothetical protein
MKGRLAYGFARVSSLTKLNGKFRFTHSCIFSEDDAQGSIEMLSLTDKEDIYAVV